jgi:hypothetical protein
MAELRNPVLRQLYEAHIQDATLLRLLNDIEMSQTVFDTVDMLEARRIQMGLVALTPDQLFRNKINKLVSVNRSILNTLSHMVTQRYNIDQAQIIFAQIIDNNMRILNIQNAPTGMQQVADMILQIPLPDNQRRLLYNPAARDVVRPAAQAAAPRRVEPPVVYPARELRAPVDIADLENLTNEQKIELGEAYLGRLQCPACMIKESNIVLIPCGHLLCSNCVNRLKIDNEAANRRQLCPMCRIEYTNVHDIFYKKYLKYKNKYLKLKNDV